MPSNAAAPVGPVPVVVTIEPAELGERLDRILASRALGLSRARLQALIKAGHVSGDGRTIGEPGHRVKPGEVYRIAIPAPAPAEPQAEDLPLSIVFEDDDLIVIDKPAGLVVHPAPGHGAGTLVNALLAHCGESLSGIGGVRRPGIVHRLDKDTSGLLVVAKSDSAHQGLAAQFAAHGRDGRLSRAYLAVVWGRPAPARGRIEAALARKASDRTRMTVVSRGGRPAATRYSVEETYAGTDRPEVASLVRCELETGRTHQIRVHLASRGHPLLGDRAYGRGFANRIGWLGEESAAALTALGRQALHATELGFEHPQTGRHLHFSRLPPPDLGRLITALRRDGVR